MVASALSLTLLPEILTRSVDKDECRTAFSTVDISRKNHDVSFRCVTIAAYTLSIIATDNSQFSANSGLFGMASRSERPLGPVMGRIFYGKYGSSALSFIAPHNPNLSHVAPAASKTE